MFELTNDIYKCQSIVLVKHKTLNLTLLCYTALFHCSAIFQNINPSLAHVKLRIIDQKHFPHTHWYTKWSYPSILYICNMKFGLLHVGFKNSIQIVKCAYIVDSIRTPMHMWRKINCPHASQISDKYPLSQKQSPKLLHQFCTTINYPSRSYHFVQPKNLYIKSSDSHNNHH